VVDLPAHAESTALISDQPGFATKTSSPFHNIIRLASGDLVAKALSFLAFIYLARILGVSDFGILEFASSVLTYLLLLGDGGLEMWGTREASKTTDLPALVERILPFRLLLAFVAFAILLLLLPFFPHYPNLRGVILLYGLSVFAQAISLKWVFMGQQAMDRVARGLVIGQLLFAAAILLSIHSSAGLLWIPVLRLGGDLATAVYFARWFRRVYGRFPLKMSLGGMALTPALTLGLSQAMGLLNYNFDSVLLGFMRGPILVGWYNAAYKLILIGLTFPITYVVGLFPSLSRSFAESREEFRLLVRRSIELWLVFIVPLIVGGFFLADPVIQFLYGPEYAQASTPLKILVWSAALVTLRMVYSNSLRATGFQRLDLGCAMASAGINVTLNFILIPRYGMVGAASATVSADIVWFVLSFYYFRKSLVPGESFPSLRGPLLAGAAMAFVLWLARPIFWPGRAVLSLIAYAVAMALFGSFNWRTYIQQTPQT
jgi:O-antigen/teichoic acid export membrane protein